jgi:hypothetical protein
LVRWRYSLTPTRFLLTLSRILRVYLGGEDGSHSLHGSHLLFQRFRRIWYAFWADRRFGIIPRPTGLRFLSPSGGMIDIKACGEQAGKRISLAQPRRQMIPYNLLSS